jgi:hypothetical protein
MSSAIAWGTYHIVKGVVYEDKQLHWNNYRTDFYLLFLFRIY